MNVWLSSAIPSGNFFCQEMPRREVMVELNTVSRVLGFTWLMRSLNIESFSKSKWSQARRENYKIVIIVAVLE